MHEGFPFLGAIGYYYGLIIAVAGFVCLVLTGFYAYQRKMPAGTARVLGTLAIPLGLLGARLFFCLFNLPLFTETYGNPWLMLRFFDGGLSMTGFLFGFTLAVFITARICGVRFGKLLDAATLPLGLFMAACRAAEVFTELGVGKRVEEGFLTRYAPWLFITEVSGVAKEFRLAVFGYEAVAGVLIFLWLWRFARTARKKKNVRAGDLALLFFSLYGASQVFFESMRDDGHMLIIFLRVAQVFAVCMPLVAAGIFSSRYAFIRGKADARLIFSWLVLLLCVAAGVLLEFLMDGRLSWGMPSMARDYGLLAAVCAALYAVPASLLAVLRKKVYGMDHIAVRVP